MWSVKNQPSALSPGSKSPRVLEVGASVRAISARLTDGLPAGAPRRRTTPSTMSRSAAGAVERLAPDHGGGDLRGRSGHDRGARGMRADAVRDEIGAAVDHLDAAIV